MHVRKAIFAGVHVRADQHVVPGGLSCFQAVQNAKAGLPFKREEPFFPAGDYLRQRREFGSQIPREGIQSRRGTLYLNDDAFRAVADRAAEAVFPRKAEYEGAEAHPLHLSGQRESAPLLHAHARN
jgi:hypothetical protein